MMKKFLVFLLLSCSLLAKNSNNIFIAIENNNIDSVHKLISIRSNLNVKNIDDLNPLQYSCVNGKIDIARLLISEGADINQANSDGYTPLLLAIKNGFQELALDLIKSGANVSLSTNQNISPLMFACNYGFFDLIKIIIEKKANINQQDNIGNNCLIYANKTDNVDIIKYLINNGANINQKNSLGNTPIMNAIYNKNYNILDYYLTLDLDLTVKNSQGHSLLSIAVLKQDYKYAKIFIEKGLNINNKDIEGQTPIDYSLKYNYEDITKLLLSSGAYSDEAVLKILNSNLSYLLENMIDNKINFSKKDSNGNSIFLLASKNSSLKTLQKLVEKGAKPNEANVKNGISPLMNSIIYSNDEVIPYLISLENNINRKDRLGKSALYYAVEYQLTWITKLLIEKGADTRIILPNGETLLMLAARNNNTDIINLLNNDVDYMNYKDFNGLSALNYALENNSIKSFYLLEEKGANIFTIDNYNQNLLFYFFKSKDSIIFEELIKKGLNINQINNKKESVFNYILKTSQSELLNILISNNVNTQFSLTFDELEDILFHCIHYNDKTILDFLIEKKLNINKEYFGSRTLLMEAALNDRLAMVKYLIKLGCDVTYINKNKETALDFAIKNKSYDTATLLLNYFNISKEKASSYLNLLFGDLNFEGLDSELINILIQKGGLLKTDYLKKAVTKGSLNVTKILIKNGLKPSNTDNLLELSILKNDKNIIEYLLNTICSPNSVDSENNPIIFMVLNSPIYSEIIDLFINRNDINLAISNNKGITLTEYALITQKKLVIRHLIKKNIEISDTLKNRYYQNYLNSISNNLDSVKEFLLKSEISKEEFDKFLPRYLDICAYNASWGTFEYLLGKLDIPIEKLSTFSSIINSIIMHDNLNLLIKVYDKIPLNNLNIDILKIASTFNSVSIFSYYYDLLIKSSNLNSLLARISERDSEKVLNYLINKKMNTNVILDNGKYFLESLIYYNCHKSLDLILSKNIKINNAKWILYPVKNGNLKTLELLTQYEADISMLTEYGDNLLEVAISWDQIDIAIFLLKKGLKTYKIEFLDSLSNYYSINKITRDIGF